MKQAGSKLGFSLIEVVMAVAITSFCLLTLLGLLSVGRISDASSLDQTTATSIAASLVSDLRTIPAGASATVRYGVPLPSNQSTVTHSLFFDESGDLSGTLDGNASAAENPTPRYRATLTFFPASGKAAMPIRILVTWPALADAVATASPSKFTGSFETVIGLNLN